MSCGVVLGCIDSYSLPCVLLCDCKCSVALPHGPWVGLQCVAVVFPDHAHLCFMSLEKLFILH